LNQEGQLPQFPLEVQLTSDLLPVIECFVSGFVPYSDFNALSLWAWDVDGSTRLGWIEGSLVVRFPGYGLKGTTYSVLGADVDNHVLASVAEHARKIGLPTSLRLVPEQVALAPGRDGRVESDPDNHDYILDLCELSTLAGRKWRSVRHKVNQFARRSDGQLLVTSLTASEENREEALQLFDAWARRRDPEFIRWERAALGRLFDVGSRFNLIGTAVRLNRELIAFDISELCFPGWAVAHFGKAHPDFPDAERYCDVAAARRLMTAGCRYWNFEQDLGIEGIRHAKLRLHPVRFLRKYSIHTEV
jgi:hypothetical protein